MHGHDFAERRYAVLVECFDGHEISDAGTERAHIEGGSAVSENLVTQIQTIRLDPPADVVTDRTRHAPPADRHHARIRTYRLGVGGRARRGATGIAEHTQIADRQVCGAHVAVHIAYVARTNG